MLKINTMKTHSRLKPAFIVIVLNFFLLSCDDGRVNFFSVADDIALGEEITAEILSNPQEFPVLDPAAHPEAYAYIYRLRDQILQSEKIRFRDRFEWNMYIIDQDVFNAFALPGGNTFYYTGLIKFLDNEASFAGVMAHEIGHSDRRHSTNRLTKIYGFQIVASLLLGSNPTLVQQIIADLALTTTALAFSRQDEYESDRFAVEYLYSTEIDPRGVAYFFEKMEAEPTPGWMAYFRTHPPDEDRISAVYEHHERLGGKDGNLFEERFRAFQRLLP
jgi:beta-barrel assembly-enhancing protease